MIKRKMHVSPILSFLGIARFLSFLANCPSSARRNVVALEQYRRQMDLSGSHGNWIAGRGEKRDEKKGMHVKKGLLIGVTTTGRRYRLSSAAKNIFLKNKRQSWNGVERRVTETFVLLTTRSRPVTASRPPKWDYFSTR